MDGFIFNVTLSFSFGVQSNTILSSSSSLFTFLVAIVFLGEKFTWLKLISVLLCMVGTIIVSLGDSGSGSNAAASNPVLGDILSLLSAAFYAAYITLIRQKLPDEDDKVQGRVSMAQFLGFLGLFNLLIFFPVTLILEFLKLELFNNLTGKQFGLIIGKGIYSMLQVAVEILRSSISKPFPITTSLYFVKAAYFLFVFTASVFLLGLPIL